MKKYSHSDFSPNDQEIKYFYANKSSGETRLLEIKRKKINRRIQFQYVCGSKKTELVDKITPFEENSDFAKLESGTKYYYIDKDLDPVICENKVKTPSQLCFLLKTNLDGVKKYVTPKKIEKIKKDLDLSILFLDYGDCGPEFEAANEQADIISNFINTLNQQTNCEY